MRGEELEALATHVRELARLAPDEVQYAPILVERLLGPEGLALVPRLACGGVLRHDGDGHYTIVVRRGVPDMNFVIAHELGHWSLREHAAYGGPVLEEEALANYLAAAILAPPHLMQKLVKQHGRMGLRPIAKAARLSETSAHLRLGDLDPDSETAVVTATHRRVLRPMGQQRLRWSDADVILAALGDMPGIRKVRLSGKLELDAGRIALVR